MSKREEKGRKASFKENVTECCEIIYNTLSSKACYGPNRKCLFFFRKETVPLIGSIPGLDKFQGPVQHSHDFRTADQYKDQTVLCVGSGASAMEIPAIVAA